MIGAFVVLGFLHRLHAAQNPSHPGHAILSGALELVAYLLVSVPIARAWRERRTSYLWAWLREDRAPLADERDLVLREPLRELVVPATLWAGAAVVFGAVTAATDGVGSGFEHMLTITLGGITTCALIYLATERLLRPVTVRALAANPPKRPVGPGVEGRLVMAWGLASGVPLLALGLLAIGALSGEFEDARSFAIAVLTLVAAGLAAGAIATVLSARALADPIGAVRRALARVHAGDFDAQVPVDDGSEIGLLQAGFNEMASGLRERERLRDLFGRHVGEDVARRALEGGVTLGGELREVAVLFVDLVGSTALAAHQPAEEVVSLLNRFFAVVVDVVDEQGGWINKFEGDAALCVFGAPTEDPDAAGSALAAGRLLAERLRREIPELEAGIGISAGPAVAGNVGAHRRLEYTVVGDPINEAARLCELAKHEPSPILASGSTVARASSGEAKRWSLEDETTLRGRTEPTRLAVPVGVRATV
ncbi:MAG TPA: adenylate/guanylate cyclase domain-containing protein [Polyangiaceae bacterium]|nr:adenylate/guanylate cyclase domain-containing protein [Polyangiaceae bacterium]